MIVLHKGKSKIVDDWVSEYLTSNLKNSQGPNKRLALLIYMFKAYLGLHIYMTFTIVQNLPDKIHPKPKGQPMVNYWGR